MKKWLFVAGVLFSPCLAAMGALPMQEAAPGIFVHMGRHELPDTANHGAIANIGFIVGDRCVAVIDSGGNPEQGIALSMAIKRVTNKPVCYVINSHVHPDHIYGNKAFKQMPGVRFVGHHKLARAMASRGQYYIDKAPEQLAVHLTADNIVPPDIEVKQQSTLELGNRTLRLTAHPTAHTDNDLSVYDVKTGTLWLADLLFIDHLPVIDGSIKGWLSELEKLEKQPYKLVIPGHGPLVKDWPQGMQVHKHYLQTLVAEIRMMIKQGKFLEDAVKTVGLSAKKQWQLFDEFHRKNVTAAFAELEWE